MEDSHKCLYNGHMALVLEVGLVVLAVHQKMLEHLLEQGHRKHVVIQIRCLAKSLFKIS